MRASLLGPGVAVPAELAADVAEALALLDAARRRDGVRPAPELVELAGLCGALAAAVARRCAGFTADPAEGGSGGSGGIAGDLPQRKIPVGTGGNWLTVMDVGSILGVSGRRVRQLASSGRLAGVRRPGGWRFDPQTVSSFAESRIS